MTCYHPLVAERHYKHSGNYDPKKPIRILGSADKLGIDLLSYEQLNSDKVAEGLLIPCGRCIGCRIDKARDWSVRIMCESFTSSSSWFLTLTYDDAYMNNLSLSKKDFQDFIKAVRNYCNYKYGVSNIRYFGCGEYGDNSGRKHLHIIMFNLPDLDIKPRSSSGGIIQYTSDILNDLWFRGFVVLESVVPETANYVARYTLKKAGLQKYEDLHVQAPFLMMSTRPGIGYTYFQEHVQEIVDRNGIFVGHKLASIPRYFKSLLGEDIQADLKKRVKDYIFDRNFVKQMVNDRPLMSILSSDEVNLLKNMEVNS